MIYYGIKSRFPDIKDEEFTLQDDGDGPYIKEWKYKLFPAPVDISNLISQGEQYFNENIKYVINRKALYPSAEEQLDILWHAMDKGEIPKATEWYDHIKSVKDKYPKR